MRQWFTKYHEEKLSSAVERYVKEINRVTGVVEGHLAAEKAKDGSKGPWLVGGKMTFADISWYMWQVVVVKVLGDESEWHQERERESRARARPVFPNEKLC